MPAVHFLRIMFYARCYQRGFTEQVYRRWRRKTGKRALGHMVEAEGMVTANREVAVDTVSGLKGQSDLCKPGRQRFCEYIVV